MVKFLNQLKVIKKVWKMNEDNVQNILIYFIQNIGNTLSFIGSVIVLFNFFSDLKGKKLFHKTMIHLIIFSCIFCLTLANYQFIQTFIFKFILPEIDNILVLRLFDRIFYLLKCIGQFFVLSCACWTLCSALSLLISINTDHNVHEGKLMFLFYFISIFIPFLDVLVWGILFQVNMTLVDNKPVFKNQRAFFASYYLFHASLLIVIFLINLILLIFIWISIKKAMKVFYYQKESISEFKIVFNLSIYIIPFLLCGSWQIIGYIIIGLNYLLPKNETVDLLLKIMIYPYSVFFPLQGFFNCLVFYLNKKKAKEFLKKICCCKKEEINQ